MKDIVINSFTDADMALTWMDDQIHYFIKKGHDDIKAELSLIDGNWRVGVITDSRQTEFRFD